MFSRYCVERNDSAGNKSLMLLVQCDNGHENMNLIASAQYCVLDQLMQFNGKGKVHVVFIIHLPRIAGRGFTGFQVNKTVLIVRLWTFF